MLLYATLPQIFGEEFQTNIDIMKLLYYNLTSSVLGDVHYQKIHPKDCNKTCFYKYTGHMNAIAVGISGVNAIGHGNRTPCTIGMFAQLKKQWLLWLCELHFVFIVGCVR